MAIPDVLPQTEAEWVKAFGEQSLKSESIYGDHVLESASQLTFNHFLLLHAICPPAVLQDRFYQNVADWIQRDNLKAADASLKTQESWRLYHKSYQPTSSRQHTQTRAALAKLGPFSLVRYYQLQVEGLHSSDESSTKVTTSPVASRTRQRQAKRMEVLQTPTRPRPGSPPDVFDMTNLAEHLDRDTDSISSTSSTGLPEKLTPFSPLGPEASASLKAVSDEQIVNTALILYLNAITLHCDDVRGDWTLHRKAFVVKSLDGEKVYEARVDGYLGLGDRVGAIVEVKPFLRGTKYVPIRMQETAQMAAWICNDPPDTKKMRAENINDKRLLISQDRNEIYLTFAVYDADYVDYIRGRQYDKRSFLVMNEFGPFHTEVQSHMHVLAKIMLAFSLEKQA
ncbi:hypothetical protein F4778DRAFT_753258 [Xylariomycetidae sp. FL2044]|nr:hypothetical protein F4778DRAFT_753258 [Xylariomycetidae sp. FL2044]